MASQWITAAETASRRETRCWHRNWNGTYGAKEWMSDEEKAAFEAEMETDEELKKQYQITKVLKEVLSERARLREISRGTFAHKGASAYAVRREGQGKGHSQGTDRRKLAVKEKAKELLEKTTVIIRGVVAVDFEPKQAVFIFNQHGLVMRPVIIPFFLRHDLQVIPAVQMIPERDVETFGNTDRTDAVLIVMNTISTQYFLEFLPFLLRCRMHGINVFVEVHIFRFSND